MGSSKESYIRLEHFNPVLIPFFEFPNTSFQTKSRQENDLPRPSSIHLNITQSGVPPPSDISAPHSGSHTATMMENIFHLLWTSSVVEILMCACVIPSEQSLMCLLMFTQDAIKPGWGLSFDCGKSYCCERRSRLFLGSRCVSLVFLGAMGLRVAGGLASMASLWVWLWQLEVQNEWGGFVVCGWFPSFVLSVFS